MGPEPFSFFNFNSHFINNVDFRIFLLYHFDLIYYFLHTRMLENIIIDEFDEEVIYSHESPKEMDDCNYLN